MPADNAKIVVDIDLLPAPDWMQEITAQILGPEKQCYLVDILALEEKINEQLDKEMFTVLEGQEVKLSELVGALTTYAGQYVIFPLDLQNYGQTLIEALLTHEKIHETAMSESYTPQTLSSLLEDINDYCQSLLEGLFPGNADQVAKEIAEIVHAQIVECLVNRVFLQQHASLGWVLLEYLLQEFPREDPLYYSVYGIDLLEFILFVGGIRTLGAIILPGSASALLEQQELSLPDFARPFYQNVQDVLSDVIFNENYLPRDFAYTARALTRLLTELENNVNYGMYYTALEDQAGVAAEDILAQVANSLEEFPDLPTTNMVRRFIGAELYAKVTQDYAIPWMDEHGIVDVEAFFRAYEEGE
ncbi:MAG TPA: hypothetical protein VKK79_10385, partial [Candidatus Lokiarchaeia archaeon]|nr:hypothetical protein [Candidatus Lokiarchaeia archaeon]